MFKTVKVGDTSLQYTIVSQTEDSTSNCPSSVPTTTTRKNKIKRKTRHRHTVILILITLIMGCGIVIAAVLVPILVASKIVGNLPESARFQTFAIAASSLQGYGKHDQNGNKYVELLPIKQAPVDSVIEFQDDIPIMEDNKWRTDFRLNFNALKSPKAQLPSAAAQPPNVQDKPSVSNLTQVTNYHNKSENVTAFPQSISSTIESQSTWSGLIRLLKTFIDFMVQKRITPIIQAACFILIVVIAIIIIKCRRRKRRIEKVESLEHKAQRKQLLSAIPIEDD